MCTLFSSNIIRTSFAKLGLIFFSLSETSLCTVDLEIDHSFFSNKPIYWETMIFDHTNGEDFGDLYCERYSSLEDAIANHERILTLVNEGDFSTIKELGDACIGFYNLER